ncbi:MAG: hypothetical protein IT317_12250 [Anaerolineales bacterium]|nr:hypothetical protein [Anaerolineales bacterium]
MRFVVRLHVRRATTLTIALLSLLALSAAPALPAAPTAPAVVGPGTPELLHTFGPLGSQSVFNTQLYHNWLYLSAYDANGIELWRSDGTVTGTVRLSDLTDNSVVDSLSVANNGGVFFGANPAGVGYELHYSAGQPGDAQRLTDFLGSSDGLYGYPAVLGNTAYFAAYVSGGNRDLWRSDGTVTGTTHIHDVDPAGLLRLDNVLLFAGLDADGYELWRTDGTNGGTWQVRNIWPGATGSLPTMRLAWNHRMLFTASAEGLGTELWVTDGTGPGTGPVFDIASGNASSQINSVADSDLGWVYLLADDGVHGKELWHTDGTSGGTYMLQDVYIGSTSSSPTGMTAAGGWLYFVATDAAHGAELWRTSGSPASTQLVRDIYTGTTGSSIKALAAHDGLLYFSADDGVHGQELWRTDGTYAGTELVADIVPGPTGSNPNGLAWSYRWLLFAATDAANGRELWVSDGVPGGDTHLHANLEPGNAGSNPICCAVAAGQVYLITQPDGSSYEGFWGLTVAPFEVTNRVYLPATLRP